VFITGPSGCGKSSLIKAGVIPALRAGLLTRAGYRWQTTKMRPGQQPLVNLARAFEDAFDAGTSGSKPSGNEFFSLLESDEAGLWAVMDQAENLRRADGHALLLLVDQFEEIFGPQIKNLSEVDAFVRLLVTQYARPHPSLYIVFTIRSDYLGQCVSFPGLSDAINHCQYLTPALTASELRQAIVRPAEDYGAHVSEGLVDDILTDMKLRCLPGLLRPTEPREAMMWYVGAALASGGLVGFSLGLVGGDGSVLATPLCHKESQAVPLLCLGAAFGR
jgi:hypothetical protein